ncbi:MAG: nicotinate mononucleotide-dependent phosphoribosyltransferase CobT [Chloroflexota bacterium]
MHGSPSLNSPNLSSIYPPPPVLSNDLGSEHHIWHDAIAPIHRAKTVFSVLDEMNERSPLFVCVAAHTDTSSIPGISSAGASLELIPFTPAADLESLRYGHPTSLRTVPSNPLGPPGPALITRAALALANMRWLPVTIGLRVSPSIASHEIQHGPGGRIDVARGVEDAEGLFRSGQMLGHRLATQERALVIGETVPGGTTTAMAVLRALGHPYRVSSSMNSGSVESKEPVIARALARARLSEGSGMFEILTELGDPMQPFVAGLLFAAAPRAPIILAGGTQMAAVLAIVNRLEQERAQTLPRDQIVLATTPWVARDPNADLKTILQGCGNWAGAVPRLDFSAMRCSPLRAYEQLLVKEGVGAGGACLTALARCHVSITRLHDEIDAQYLHLPGATDA